MHVVSVIESSGMIGIGRTHEDEEGHGEEVASAGHEDDILAMFGGRLEIIWAGIVLFPKGCLRRDIGTAIICCCRR